MFNNRLEVILALFFKLEELKTTFTLPVIFSQRGLSVLKDINTDSPLLQETALDTVSKTSN